MTFKEFINEWQNDEDFIEAKSSGSTGVPKIIHLKKDFVAESARRTNEFFRINAKSVLHSCVSPDFIGGKMMAVRAIISNARLSWEIPSNVPLLSPSDGVIDLLAVVPSQMISIIERKDDLPHIRNIIVGGSRIHPALVKMIEKSSLNAYETYGMTETASHIALRKISSEKRPFTLLPGIRIESDYDGCLKIFFENGYTVKTNDIVEIITEKEFYIKGRRDEIINTGGKKLNPNEIEDKISGLLSCRYCVTGFPDMKWGEKVVLLLESPQAYDEETLKEKMKKILEPWQMPKEILRVEKLPLTPNGKIIRPKDPALLVYVSDDTSPSS